MVVFAMFDLLASIFATFDEPTLRPSCFPVPSSSPRLTSTRSYSLNQSTTRCQKIMTLLRSGPSIQIAESRLRRRSTSTVLPDFVGPETVRARPGPWSRYCSSSCS